MDFTILHFAIHIVWRANVICTCRKSGIARKTTVAYPELRLVGSPDCEIPQSYNHVPLMIYGKGIKPEIRQEPGGQTDVAPTLLGLLNMSYTQNDFGINLLTEQRPYVYFSADNLIAATDTTHLYIYSPHDRQEFKYKKQGNALQLVTGEDSTFYVMKKYCFSTLQSAEYLVKEHKTVNKATGQ